MPPSRVVAVVVLAVALLAGCSGTTPVRSEQTPSPDAAATDCRSEWKALGDQLTGRDHGRFVSDLGSRWAALQASVDYYVTSATGDDCGATLDAQKKAVARTESWSSALRVYDVRYRLDQRRDAATAYLKKPRKKPPAKLVRQALRLATKTAPAAVADMHDGWAEASTVDLSSATARTKALGDMKFLAGDSLPYQRCAAALKVLARVS